LIRSYYWASSPCSGNLTAQNEEITLCASSSCFNAMVLSYVENQSGPDRLELPLHHEPSMSTEHLRSPRLLPSWRKNFGLWCSMVSAVFSPQIWFNKNMKRREGKILRCDLHGTARHAVPKVGAGEITAHAGLYCLASSVFSKSQRHEGLSSPDSDSYRIWCLSPQQICGGFLQGSGKWYPDSRRMSCLLM
jgi:hypothetical protein